MSQKVLIEYIQSTLRKGFSRQSVKKALSSAEWTNQEINDAFFQADEMMMKDSKMTKTLPLAPKKSGWNLDLGTLSASQILLYLGSIIIVIAGFIYVGIHWEYWGPIERILAILIPMLILFAGGSKFWIDKKKEKAVVTLFTGAILFPLFMSVTLTELKIFAPQETINFNLAISLSSLVFYILLHFIFPFYVWSFLTLIAGTASYYFTLDFFHIDKIYGSEIWGWAFLVLGLIYVFMGMFQEKRKKKEMSTLIYLFGFMISFFALWRLSLNADLIKAFMPNSNGYFPDQVHVGWSFVIVGGIYLLASMAIEKMEKRGWNIIGAYAKILSTVGIFMILGAILYLSSNGKKFFYETLLLIASLGAIFGSIPKSASQFLFAGTFFLIIYIFDIGAEYFKNDVGWPITLFAAGLISMGISFAMETIRKKYFKKDE
ncbi:hypothetical protein HYV57_01145 [Candidatus Peregrinibacteria bacterium]|nr:hypothetical protein [Candidatus Peregrinibacteria bacterium]